MTNNVYEDLRKQPEIKLLFSGKLGSGKDTVAAAVSARLSGNSSRISFAEGVRREVNEVIDLIRAANSQRDCSEDISRKMDIPFQSARDMVDILYQAVKDDNNLSADMRTNTMRTALQYWGPTVRRSQNKNYWVDKAMRNALLETRKGNLVYITDGRFPNEIDAAAEAGFVTIRLETPEESRIMRIKERDGKPPEPAALHHSSETALDNYVNFDLILDNSADVAAIVDSIVVYVNSL